MACRMVRASIEQLLPWPLSQIGKAGVRPAILGASTRPNDRMRFALDVFRDFHVHGASAPEWNQRYLQISHGQMRSCLVEVKSGAVHVFRKWMSERVVQQGCLPAGKICFAVLNGETGRTPRMNGREVRLDNLFILRSGDEFTLQRPQGMELLAVTFEGEDFRRLVDLRGWSAHSRSLLSRSAVQARISFVQRLRHDLLTILATPSAGDLLHSPERNDAGAAPVVFEALNEVFVDAACERQALGSASASFLVAECHRIVGSSGHAPPSIDALCARLRTSRRSLQSSFRQVADTTPVHYLRSLRLNAVRGRLMSTRPRELSVAQAATDQGFSHLSHFSQRYNALFGELPSQTPRSDALATRAALVGADVVVSHPTASLERERWCPNSLHIPSS